MKTDKLTPHQQKIIDAMAKVSDYLIAYKKRMDSPLVISQNGKIVHIKPWLNESDKTKDK
ncbi:hypothetical protein [uncultured Flavobacterium sp.]|uniref:hypothetical protein n=1 Tax=uncultured Flavobacterium sp. TaxID=165435 RepID=UPI0025F0CDCC|nr:hypothetical protein [uncultured Flavobacterium sp.]